MPSDDWIKELPKVKPQKTYSQYGEESFLQFIFQNIGTTNKYFVDIGANDGKRFSNTRLFKENGWNGLMIDGNFENELVKKHFVTVDNILNILEKYEVPYLFDLLSIDIDGNEYWILDKVLSDYSPRVIISEYNAEQAGCKTIKYNPDFKFKENDYYGYTFEAGLKLADKYGYRIIHQNSELNLYYLRKDCMYNPNGGINVINKYRKWWGNPEWVWLG